MLADFKNLTNHLLAYALQTRTKGAFKLRDAQYGWFDAHYGGRYAVHYLHSASSYANGIAKSWRKMGKSKFPHLKRGVAKLDQMLVKVMCQTPDGIKLRVTIAPKQYAVLDLPVHHKKFAEYSKYKLGEIIIHEDGSIDLPFQIPDDKPDSTLMSGTDYNFNSADIATSEGVIKSISLKPITRIQANMRKKREAIRKSVPKNLKKQYRVLAKYKRREHNRIKQRVMDLGKEIGAAIDGLNIEEDLAKTTDQCMKRGKCGRRGKKFNKKLSSWVHGRLQESTSKNTPCKTEKIDPRGTSSQCPFCHSPVTHPTWSVSLCPIHGPLDRNKLAAVAILERGRMDLCREPFPANVYASLLEGSVLGDEGTNSSQARPDNRYDPMIEDATNVNAEFYELREDKNGECIYKHIHPQNGPKTTIVTKC